MGFKIKKPRKRRPEPDLVIATTTRGTLVVTKRGDNFVTEIHSDPGRMTQEQLRSLVNSLGNVLINIAMHMRNK